VVVGSMRFGEWKYLSLLVSTLTIPKLSIL
jgi:hypothetical protein